MPVQDTQPKKCTKPFYAAKSPQAVYCATFLSFFMWESFNNTTIEERLEMLPWYITIISQVVEDRIPTIYWNLSVIFYRQTDMVYTTILMNGSILLCCIAWPMHAGIILLRSPMTLRGHNNMH
jgi:hypothetical protein